MVQISISPMNRGHCSEPVPAAFTCRPAADEDKQRLDDVEEAQCLRAAAVTLSQASEGERESSPANVRVVVGLCRT